MCKSQLLWQCGSFYNFFFFLAILSLVQPEWHCILSPVNYAICPISILKLSNFYLNLLQLICHLLLLFEFSIVTLSLTMLHSLKKWNLALYIFSIAPNIIFLLASPRVVNNWSLSKGMEQKLNIDFSLWHFSVPINWNFGNMEHSK